MSFSLPSLTGGQLLRFLHLSHLLDGKDYDDASNLGLMDQIMALKWVHENMKPSAETPTM